MRVGDEGVRGREVEQNNTGDLRPLTPPPLATRPAVRYQPYSFCVQCELQRYVTKHSAESGRLSARRGWEYALARVREAEEIGASPLYPCTAFSRPPCTPTVEGREARHEIFTATGWDGRLGHGYRLASFSAPYVPSIAHSPQTCSSSRDPRFLLG